MVVQSLDLYFASWHGLVFLSWWYFWGKVRFWAVGMMREMGGILEETGCREVRIKLPRQMWWWVSIRTVSHRNSIIPRRKIGDHHPKSRKFDLRKLCAPELGV